jgi:RNA-binding protein YhbY
MQLISTVQIGKNGMTENTVETIRNHFKNRKNVRVVFLKSSTRNKKKLKEDVEGIVDNLGKNYTFRILGFTAFIKKWRKPKR